MSKLAARPRLTADDYLTIALMRDNSEGVRWLRDNLPALRGMVESWNHRADPGEQHRELVQALVAADMEANTPPELRAPVLATDPSDPRACSVCMAIIEDLDAPCPACVAAGRLAGTPAPGHGADIAELRRAHDLAPAAVVHPLDAPGATPTIETVREVVPRMSNSINRAPLPPSPPPARVYRADETCNSCGRLAELHEDRGGPIGHGFQPQSAPVIT